VLRAFVAMCRAPSLQHTATHCNTLQHTARHIAMCRAHL